ncbi:hypothetical protein PARPLA_00607 [Rhodobacteraceae bacterium THAF1]|uniref:DUF2793 domain-containing protein n=1 Tax=Palleronia sp. THAF1 TaxID=2587842 RepID=UPI000F3FFF94|nr:DUF2793 domain-containing protein [Palleronia sp. THAF1]QFU09830.1 hypothetical protein FIU81_14225 [Palleronia sp. THAF1]VDC17267.1 hypothetical protein PARPLA_00607 [Rhodobacteraceae bacterium THAF1]
MSDNSPNLDLPLIQAAQAQKHVTHNEALARLDVLSQLVVQGVDTVSPPDTPVDGQAWIVGADPTGDWVGADGQIAAWLNGGWVFVTPQIGWIAVEATTGALRVFGAAGWRGPVLSDIDRLGVGAAADDTNRLSVASPATLLSHAGDDHRLTVNKANTSATGSLLFQSNFSGRAEMGLAGEDAFSVKVSGDGASWTTALRVDPTSGTMDGAAVQQAPTDTTAGRLMRADYGYGPGNVLAAVAMTGDVPTGGLIETDGSATARYTRFADGTQICTGRFEDIDITLDIEKAGGFTGPRDQVDYPMPFVEPPIVMVNLLNTTDAILFNATGGLTRVAYGLWSAVSATVSVRARYVAFGRWF